MMIQTIGKTLFKTSGVGLVGGASYGTYLHQTDDGFRRAMQAYRTVLPVALHYRYLEFVDQTVGTTLDDWEALDERYAVSTVSKLGELQGMYCKYCQTAAGWNNTFGEAWIREFRKLENQVPPRDIDAIYQTIEEETAGPSTKALPVLMRYRLVAPRSVKCIGRHYGTEVARLPSRSNTPKPKRYSDTTFIPYGAYAKSWHRNTLSCWRPLKSKMLPNWIIETKRTTWRRSMPT